MTEKSSVPSKRSNAGLLNEILEHRLLLYTLAAGTTLACSPSAQAEVVFTPSNIYFHRRDLNIDIDNDGTVDFAMNYAGEGCSSTSSRVRNRSCYSIAEWWVAPPVGGPVSNGLAARGTHSYAAALRRGDLIGRPQDSFGGKFLAVSTSGNPGGYWVKELTNRYLGIRFSINGEVHYGWIGFIHTSFFSKAQAHFAGWAYETVPNKPIYAGDKGSGSEFPASFDPDNATSLELRSMGHVGQPALQNRAADPDREPAAHKGSTRSN